jgi:tetratricopeptide (TPR) repeat protein
MDVQLTAEESYRRGRQLLAQGHKSDAFDYFRTAHTLDGSNPRYRSYYGLCLALVESRFNEGLELCRSAAKEEFFNPELYHNLARVHLAFGFKAEGIRYVRRGLMIDPGHLGMRDELCDLGVRRAPILPFLPRRHRLNRWLGRLRERTRDRTHVTA